MIQPSDDIAIGISELSVLKNIIFA